MQDKYTRDFNEMWRRTYQTLRDLKRILLLGNWKYFFLNDMNYLPDRTRYDYIVDGDSRKIVRVKRKLT